MEKFHNKWKLANANIDTCGTLLVGFLMGPLLPPLIPFVSSKLLNYIVTKSKLSFNQLKIYSGLARNLQHLLNFDIEISINHYMTCLT